MRKLAVLAFALAACGGGGEEVPAPVDTTPADTQPPDTQPPPPDAPTYDFSCMGNTAPAKGTAIDPLAISGTASDVNVISQNLEPVEGVTVKAFTTDDTELDTATSDANGAFALSVDTSTDPIDGYVEGTKIGHRTLRVYPPTPLTAAFADVPLLMIAEGTFSLLTTMVLGEAQDADKGVVALVVTDCANTPIAGAVPTVTQNGTAVGSMYDGSLLQDGLTLFLNVPAGDTDVSATFDGMTLRAHQVESTAGATAATTVKPGF